jgi:hypothetical protein
MLLNKRPTEDDEECDGAVGQPVPAPLALALQHTRVHLTDVNDKGGAGGGALGSAPSAALGRGSGSSRRVVVW